jgi:hypothetical protein
MKSNTCIIKYANGMYAHKDGGVLGLQRTNGARFHEVATYKTRETAARTLKGALKTYRKYLTNLLDSGSELQLQQCREEYEGDVEQLEGAEIIDLQLEL